MSDFLHSKHIMIRYRPLVMPPASIVPWNNTIEMQEHDIYRRKKVNKSWLMIEISAHYE